MKVTIESKGEGENKTTKCSIEFDVSTEKIVQKIKSFMDNISDLTEDEEKTKEGGGSNGPEKES